MRGACQSFRTLDTPNFNVITADLIPAGPAASLAVGVDSPSLPEHCLFRATINPRRSAMEEMSYGIGFELRLPTAWNGRFMFQGGSVLDGVLNPAIGPVADFPSALARGFTVVSTVWLMA
jgi:feruloyl esterase